MAFGAFRRVVLGGAIACALFGCSALASFDGLVGSKESGEAGTDASIREAGGAIDGASGTDGSAIDASTSDATTLLDATTVDATHYCETLSPAPDFCDDFERDGGVQGSWNATSISGGGVVEFGAAVGNSFLRSEIPAGGNQARTAYLRLLSIAAHQKVTLKWKMRMAAPTDPNEYAEVFNIELPATGFDYRELVVAQNSAGQRLGWGATFDDGGTAAFGSTDISAAYTSGAWVTMELAIDLLARMAILKVDGTTFSATLPDVFSPGTVTLFAGISYVSSTSLPFTAFEVDLDDVAVSYQ